MSSTTPIYDTQFPTARTVTCPFCGAAPGQPCRETIAGMLQSTSIHLSRVAAAVSSVLTDKADR